MSEKEESTKIVNFLNVAVLIGLLTRSRAQGIEEAKEHFGSFGLQRSPAELAVDRGLLTRRMRKTVERLVARLEKRPQTRRISMPRPGESAALVVNARKLSALIAALVAIATLVLQGADLQVFSAITSIVSFVMQLADPFLKSRLSMKWRRSSVLGSLSKFGLLLTSILLTALFMRMSWAIRESDIALANTLLTSLLWGVIGLVGLAAPPLIKGRRAHDYSRYRDKRDTVFRSLQSEVDQFVRHESHRSADEMRQYLLERLARMIGCNPMLRATPWRFGSGEAMPSVAAFYSQPEPNGRSFRITQFSAPFAQDEVNQALNHVKEVYRAAAFDEVRFKAAIRECTVDGVLNHASFMAREDRGTFISLAGFVAATGVSKDTAELAKCLAFDVGFSRLLAACKLSESGREAVDFHSLAACPVARNAVGESRDALILLTNVAEEFSEHDLRVINDVAALLSRVSVAEGRVEVTRGQLEIWPHRA